MNYDSMDYDTLCAKLSEMDAAIEMQQRSADGVLRKITEMTSERKVLSAKVERAKTDPKYKIRLAINDKLDEAKQALLDARELAELNEINFSFKTPRGNIESYNWMSSACYNENDWYED